ncbi:MAG: DUF4493 domain-containing protein [Muribaculaceae bacterium]|nr:DUF4493 domain-containing protein [Muribaculaceae bacterium]
MKINRLSKFLTLPVLALSVMACSDIDENFPGGAGFINLDLTVDDVVVTAGSDTRGSLNIDAPKPEEFSITLTDQATGATNTWASLADFPQSQQYKTGSYTLEATYGSLDTEGFDTPCFTGSTDLVVNEAQQTNATIVCSLANAMVAINYTDAFRAYFPDWKAELHASGGNYISFDKTETRAAFLRPGDVTLLLTLTMPTGAVTTFSPAMISNAQARHLYNVNIDVNGGNVGTASLVISIDDSMADQSISIDLSDDLIAAPAPVVTPVGFTPGTPLSIVQGNTPSTQIAMDINARNGFSEVILTTQSEVLNKLGWPTEINLLGTDASTQELLTALGLKTTGLWHNPDRMAIVDFNGVIATLSDHAGTAQNISTRFTLVVKDKLSKVNDPVTLEIDMTPVDIAVTAASPAIIGVNETTFSIHSARAIDPATNLKFETTIDGNVVTLPIQSVRPAATTGDYNVTVTLPEGNANLDVTLLYCGQPKRTVTVTRKAPEYSIDVDPFASRAQVKVTAREAGIVDIVTRYIKVYVNNRQASILERDPSTGLLTVLGLEPETTYTLKTAVVDSPAGADFSQAVSFRTELARPLPNTDFEDVKQTINYRDMLSGGRFSQNSVEIFNRQNTASFNVMTPVKSWANTNAKTFCLSATNLNTWYLQPSVQSVQDAASGGYAVELRSVGFDPSGEQIPDYLQAGQPFTNYSLNVPAIKYRAAGKIFLGEYTFDPKTMTEKYVEGIGFNSRPTSLNGAYKYTPCSSLPGDCGTVIIEVIGNNGGGEIVIASGRARLPLSSTYAPFSIPLTYKHFNIKATRLKVMIASTEQIGTIAEEQTSVVTVDNPEISASIGSRLLIDDLSLAY